MDPERGGRGPEREGQRLRERKGGTEIQRERRTETQKEGIGAQRKGDRETLGGGQNQRKVDSMGEQRPKVGG